MNSVWAIVLLLFTVISSSYGKTIVKEQQVARNEEFKTNHVQENLDLAQQLGDSNAEFALDLYREFIANEQTDGENIFMSPFSISACLGMILMGSNRDTASQMTEVLHYETINDMVHEAFKDTFQKLNSTSNKYELRIANRLFAGSGLQPKPTYTFFIERLYGAGLEMVDFSRDETRIYINNWVAHKTNGHITDLLPPGSLNPLHPLVIINAIYFKGQWLNSFPASLTKQDYFYAGQDGGQYTVDMMVNMAKRFNYTYTDDFGGVQVIELPYAGKDVSMYIFLPDLNTGLKALESQLNVSKINQIIDSLEEKQIQSLEIPRFTINDKKDLRNYLIKLGLTKVFSEQSDLSGIMFDCPQIEEVYHEAYIEVNEEGTEAAGATAGAGRRNAPLHPITFKADRPFLFFITENPTRTLLFMGRFVKPDPK